MIDDHMFVVEQGGPYPATFRLQVFTAAGYRPVAVAAQPPREGPSLTNWAERYAEEVWRRHFPDWDLVALDSLLLAARGHHPWRPEGALHQRPAPCPGAARRRRTSHDRCQAAASCQR
jgi:hypothetical protein